MPKPRAKISLKKEDKKKKKATSASIPKEKEVVLEVENVTPSIELVDVVPSEVIVEEVIEEKEPKSIINNDNKYQSLDSNYPKYRKTAIRVTIGLFVFIFLITGVYSLFNNDEKNKESISKEKIEEIITKLEKHINIPKDTPTVAEVGDVSILKKENPFFYRTASVGDVVVVFKDEAILYDAIKDKIKVLMPLNNSNLSE